MAFDTYLVDSGFLVSGYPVGLGLNAAGLVREVGPGVRDIAVGDRVVVYTVHRQEGDLKSMQEYVLVPTRVVTKIPYTLKLPEAATIPDNFITAFYTLFSDLGLPVPSYPTVTAPADAGEPILVYGAGTTSGQFALQLLRSAGYTRVIATASPAHHAYLRKLGAEHVLDYHSPSITEDIVNAAGGRKVTKAVDAVAAEGTLRIVAGAVSDNARVAILLPIKEGKAVTGPQGSQLFLSIPEDRNPFAQSVEVVGVRTFLYEQDAYMRENLMPKVLPKLLELGLIEPNRVKLLDGDDDLKDRVEVALDLLRNNRVSGEKLVLAVGGSA